MTIIGKINFSIDNTYWESMMQTYNLSSVVEKSTCFLVNNPSCIDLILANWKYKYYYFILPMSNKITLFITQTPESRISRFCILAGLFIYSLIGLLDVTLLDIRKGLSISKLTDLNDLVVRVFFNLYFLTTVSFLSWRT